MEKEFIEMAERCKDEILMLRQRIAQLQPKAEAYDNIAHLLSLLPRPSMGMGEDLIWRIDRRLDELRNREVESGQE